MSPIEPQLLVVRVGNDDVAAQLFVPTGEPKAAVLIAPAMGVAQRFYAPFASWLAGHGFLVATFDYRGIGLSRRQPLREIRLNISDWARVDCAAVLNAVLERVPRQPIYWIGHSLGGQILPLVPNRERIAKIVTIATGSGYWRENSAPFCYIGWWMWYVVVLLSLRIAGYFPGKRLRKVGDLPPGVIAQWRRWCLHREYAVGAEGETVRALFAAVRTPITSLSFTDDEYMSARNTESLHSFYVNAPQTMTRLTPKDLGVARIGHFGFFRPAFEQLLWKPYLLPALNS